MSLVNARLGEHQPPDWCRTILLVTLPDREQAQAWARRLRQSGAITTLPVHIPYRLAALVEAAEARYVDVNFPDDPGPVDARIIVLTEDLIIDVRSRQIDVRARAASGQATTTVTLRPLSDVRQLAIGGDDVDWSPEQFGELEPTVGSVVARLADGTILELPQTRSARPDILVAIDLLRSGLLAGSPTADLLKRPSTE